MFKLAVVGNPIEHSKSPWVHGQFADQCKIKIDYQKILAPLDGFVETVKVLQAKGLSGINITLPFKVSAFEIADETSLREKTAGAANTFLFHETGLISADNTDGVGLVNDITQNMNFPLQNMRILLLGAGGAARGVLLPLL